MKCNNMEFLISLHIDNQLSDQEVKELLQHFEICEQCRQTYKDFLNIKTLLSGEKNIEISRYFENNVMRKIKNSNTNNNAKIIYPIFKKRIIVLAASFLFIVISSVALFTTSSVKNKNSHYDFSWYYEINQDNSEESNNTLESFMLNF
ncbi:MAG: zf-HC2 domain-containing protein [Endomicrobiaceae bacterium]|nr:zf-HC2 domain-containing protein [Endomicrobiaceae bacterium]